MAGRIAGITIDIDGNTSKLQSSLKSLDGSLRTMQNTLKDVNKLLKLDPGNTELLTQKQKNLESAIRGTKLRLNELKTAQEGVEEGSAEWDALQREIIATEQQLKGLEQEYRNFGSVGAQQVAAVGAKMQEVGGKIEGVGNTLSKTFTAPIVAAFVGAVKTTADFDSAMSQVAATMGTTVEDIQELGAFAQEMGATTAFSATEAAEALNYMALAGYDAETSMTMLPTVLDLAAAGTLSLASASDMVTDAQSALGLSIEETAAMVDQMAAASSKSNTSVGQLGEAFLKIGATARGVSGGTQELATVLGVLADNGIKGAEGGTHLRNILLSLQDNAEDGKVLFGDLAVSVYDAEGNMRSMVDIVGDVQAGLGGMTQESRDAILSGVFNKTDLAAVNALLGTSADRFEELGAAIGDSGGAASKMADTQLDNLNGDITLLKSAVEGLAISFGRILVPYIRKGVSWIQKAVDKFNALSPASKETVVKIAGVVAAIGPLLIVGGKLTSGIGKVLAMAPMIKTAITVITAALSGPLGVIALVVAAVAGLALIWHKWGDQIKAFTLGVVDGIKNAWEGLKAGVAAAVENVKAAVVEKWNGLKESVSTVVTNIKTDVYLKWVALKSLVSSAIDKIESAVVDKWESIKDSVSSAVNALKSTVVQTWSKIKLGVKTVVSSIVSTISSKFSSAWSTVVRIFNNIKSSIEEKINAARDTVSGVVETIKGFFDFDLKIPDIKFPTWEDIKGTVESLWNNIKGFFNDAIQLKFKLPKITMGTKDFQTFAGTISIPWPEIKWERKGYMNPVMFTKPTVMATPNGYYGFGDGHGAEIVLGLNKLRELVGSSGNQVTINVYPPAGANVEQIAAAVEQKLVAAQQRRIRVYA